MSTPSLTIPFNIRHEATSYSNHLESCFYLPPTTEVHTFLYIFLLTLYLLLPPVVDLPRSYLPLPLCLSSTYLPIYTLPLPLYLNLEHSPTHPSFSSIIPLKQCSLLKIILYSYSSSQPHPSSTSSTSLFPPVSYLGLISRFTGSTCLFRGKH